MSTWLVEFLNIPEGLARGIQFFAALVFVLFLFFVVMFVISRLRQSANGSGFGRRDKERLGVLEQTFVDQRRRLLLIRRDDVEHLVMTGGPTDLVIESQIVRRQPVSQQARPIPVQIPHARQPATARQPAASPPSMAPPQIDRAETASRSATSTKSPIKAPVNADLEPRDQVIEQPIDTNAVPDEPGSRSLTGLAGAAATVMGATKRGLQGARSAAQTLSKPKSEPASSTAHASAFTGSTSTGSEMGSTADLAVETDMTAHRSVNATLQPAIDTRKADNDAEDLAADRAELEPDPEKLPLSLNWDFSDKDPLKTNKREPFHDSTVHGNALDADVGSDLTAAADLSDAAPMASVAPFSRADDLPTQQLQEAARAAALTVTSEQPNQSWATENPLKPPKSSAPEQPQTALQSDAAGNIEDDIAAQLSSALERAIEPGNASVSGASVASKAADDTSSPDIAGVQEEDLGSLLARELSVLSEAARADGLSLVKGRETAAVMPETSMQSADDHEADAAPSPNAPSPSAPSPNAPGPNAPGPNAPASEREAVSADVSTVVPDAPDSAASLETVLDSSPPAEQLEQPSEEELEKQVETSGAETAEEPDPASASDDSASELSPAATPSQTPPPMPSDSPTEPEKPQPEMSRPEVALPEITVNEISLDDRRTPSVRFPTLAPEAFETELETALDDVRPLDNNAASATPEPASDETTQPGNQETKEEEDDELSRLLKELSGSGLR